MTKIYSEQDEPLLTPIQETIIKMKISGMRYKEIADKLNYSLTNCSNQVHYAKRKVGVKTLKELEQFISL
jgi:DNA-binding NarL/FixJ family response regulator